MKNTSVFQLETSLVNAQQSCLVGQEVTSPRQDEEQMQPPHRSLALQLTKSIQQAAVRLQEGGSKPSQVAPGTSQWLKQVVDEMQTCSKQSIPVCD